MGPDARHDPGAGGGPPQRCGGLPDFVTTVGPLIAAVDSSTDLVGLIDVAGQRIGGIIEEVRDHPEGPLVGAAIRAEEFLSTWQAQLPFGRPIA